MSDLGPQWSKDELLRFYEAYHRHGKNWKKVSASVGGKSADRVEALYSAHKTFLSLPEREGTAMGFVALVTGHHNVSDESKRHKEGDQTVRASRKTWTCGEATGKKERELPNAHRSYHERTYGLSSFKKRYYRDEMLTLDVLETLVTVPSEISEPKINIPSGILGKNDSALSLKRVEGTSSVKRSKQGKQVGECISKKRNKRRKKSIAEVVPAEEPNISNHLNLPEERQADATECALNFDPERGLVDLPESTANICSEVPDLTSQTKPEINMFRRSKRKSKRQCGSKYAISNRSDNLQARRLQHCLSSESLRRWCTYEWFYSAFDYPWFMDNDLVNYLNFANLSHLSRLTRSEWSTIKSSLGKPRRFSDHFLVVEKEKLEVYRKKVRQHYDLLCDDSHDSLPPDLARPFSIGQQVIVCHPMTRELSDGEVVMMEYDGYRVQFDRPDVGVDKVKDTECMPVNWLDNLPNDLKRKSFLLNNSHNREVEQIPDLTSNEIWDHISGEPVPSKTMHRTSDEQVEIALDTKRLSNKSTSGNCGPLQPLQLVDDIVRGRDWSKHSNGHSDELDSYITSFVEMSLSQAKKMVDEVMQTISENGKNSLEEKGISNEVTDCKSPEPEFISASELPGKLIFNCIATVLAIKDLSENRHLPAKIAGVLERACIMLRPSCSQNIPITYMIVSVS